MKLPYTNVQVQSFKFMIVILSLFFFFLVCLFVCFFFNRAWLKFSDVLSVWKSSEMQGFARTAPKCAASFVSE